MTNTKPSQFHHHAESDMQPTESELARVLNDFQAHLLEILGLRRKDIVERDLAEKYSSTAETHLHKTTDEAEELWYEEHSQYRILILSAGELENKVEMVTILIETMDALLADIEKYVEGSVCTEVRWTKTLRKQSLALVSLMKEELVWRREAGYLCV